MTKREQILTWGGVVLLLLFLVLGLKGSKTIVVEGDTIMGPQLGGFPDIVVLNPDYQLGDITIDRGMAYPPTGTCGCARGSGAMLDLAPVNIYMFPPLPPVEMQPFTPTIPKGPVPLPSITVCKDKNFGSKCLTFRSPVVNMNTTGLGLNDGASSLRVVGKWELFEHANFVGRRLVVEDEEIYDLKPVGFNDIISSMRPVRQ